MTDSEKAQIRMTCVNEAIKLKQLSNTCEEYAKKSVVKIAKELESFILNGNN